MKKILLKTYMDYQTGITVLRVNDHHSIKFRVFYNISLATSALLCQLVPSNVANHPSDQ